MQRVFREFWDRNNLGCIVRVLGVVGLVEGDEIGEFVQEELDGIRDRSCGKLAKGQYGRYAQLVV